MARAPQRAKRAWIWRTTWRQRQGGVSAWERKAKEGSANRIDVFTAIGTLVGLSQKPGREDRAKQEVQMHQALPTQMLNPLTHGGQARAPGGEEGSVHMTSIYTCHDLTASLNWGM